MSKVYYPREYEKNYDFLHREIADIAVDLMKEFQLFHSITVNHISVIGIFFCFDNGHNQIEFDIKMGCDQNNPYIVELVWYINNREVPLDEVLSLLGSYHRSKFLLYNLDLFSRRKIDVREIRSNND
jgi:hypothetical protein